MTYVVLLYLMYTYLDELNAEQRAAVEHTGSPLLIMAGAWRVVRLKQLTYKDRLFVSTAKPNPS